MGFIMDQCVLKSISNFNSDCETVYSMHEKVYWWSYAS